MTTLLVCRSRAHARIGAAQAHAIRQYAGAAPGGAGNGLCRRCQRGARPRTVPGKVRKFAYDTRFGFCASRSREVLNQAAPDSMLAFVIDDNVFVHKVSKTWEIEAGAVTAQWSPFPGIEVTTTITPTATGHRRIMRLTAVSTAKPTTAVLPCPILHRATPKAWKAIPPKPLRHVALHRARQGRSSGYRLRPQHQPVFYQRPSARREVPHPQGTHRTGHRDP